ncbi:MAG: lasso peptide biosynthesis B2 protein [Nevskiaceae bacterium]
MPGKLAKFLALPVAERAVLLQALVALPATALALRHSGFEAVALPALAGNPAPPRAATSPDPKRIAVLVGIAARNGPYHGNCLSQSLALWRLLHRRGVTSTLRIGARRSAAGLEAHAWIEHAGTPLNDARDVAQRFPPFRPLAAADLPPLV